MIIVKSILLVIFTFISLMCLMGWAIGSISAEELPNPNFNGLFKNGTCVEDSDQGNGCALVVDNTTSTFWQSANTFPHYVGYDLGVGKTATPTMVGFLIWNSGGTGINTFRIDGSSDGSSWNMVASSTAYVVGAVADSTWFYQSFANTTSTYRYWRAFFTDNPAGGTTNILRELQMYATSTPVVSNASKSQTIWWWDE